MTEDMATLWNGASGHAWVEAQELLDGMFQPFQERLVAEIAADPRFPVLDVGCGTGSTTVAIARLAGASAVGVDISEPMLAAARARAEREGNPARFVHGDAETYPFDTESFGTIVSRFGVMFFDDPVRAFTNLRRAAKRGAGLRLVVWRTAAENPFMTTAERAAAAVLADIPARQSSGPGQFALADAAHVTKILAESGWSHVELRPMDAVCTLPERELRRYVTKLGPLGRILRSADEATRSRVVEAVMPAFAPFVQGADVRFTAACWMVEARHDCSGASASRR